MTTKRNLQCLGLIFACCICVNVLAQGTHQNAGQYVSKTIPMRERVQIEQRFWQWKRDNVLPQIMREQNVDLWIVRNDEEPLYRMTSYREHPVFTSLLPANHEGMVMPSVYEDSVQDVPEFLFFYDRGDSIEYIEPCDNAAIANLVQKRDPDTIALSRNGSEDLKNALGKKYADRTVDSWTLGVRWLESVTPEQISIYTYVQGLHNDIIAEGYSNAVVVPDVTTTDDLNWWFRQKYLDLDLEIENHPTVIVQRRPELVEKYGTPPGAFRNNRTRNGVNVIIRRGDVISLDSDIMIMGVITDSHQHAYVLQEGETDIPEELNEALRLTNHMQDEFRKSFVVGRSGKQIVADAKKVPRDPKIISSNLAFHPPPRFIRRFTENGLMFSRGSYVAGLSTGPGYKLHPIVGDRHKLYYNTMYAYEPHTRVRVTGWGEPGVELGLGQMAVFTETGLHYLNRVQENAWHVVR